MLMTLMHSNNKHIACTFSNNKHITCIVIALQIMHEMFVLLGDIIMWGWTHLKKKKNPFFVILIENTNEWDNARYKK